MGFFFLFLLGSLAYIFECVNFMYSCYKTSLLFYVLILELFCSFFLWFSVNSSSFMSYACTYCLHLKELNSSGLPWQHYMLSCPGFLWAIFLNHHWFVYLAFIWLLILWRNGSILVGDVFPIANWYLVFPVVILFGSSKLYWSFSLCLLIGISLFSVWLR